MHAGVAELVDAPDSKSGFFGSAGSIPAPGTTCYVWVSARFLIIFGPLDSDDFASAQLPRSDNASFKHVLLTWQRIRGG